MTLISEREPPFYSFGCCLVGTQVRVGCLHLWNVRFSLLTNK